MIFGNGRYNKLHYLPMICFLLNLKINKKQKLKNTNTTKVKLELLKKLSGIWKGVSVLDSEELINDIYNSRTISDKKVELTLPSPPH